MFLTVDIGNTNIVLALYDGLTWTHSFRYESKEVHPLIHYINGINEILLEWDVSPSDIRNAAMSSVVPHLNEKISHAIDQVIGFKPHVIGPEDFIDLDMHVPKIYEIGSDLVANSYAAIKKYKKDSLIIDFGTALTFTVVEVENGIKGVSIAPGLKTAMESLSSSTAQLPEIWLSWPEFSLGSTTEEAIRSGVLIGYYGLVKEMTARIQKDYPHVDNIVGTGGLVSVLKPLSSMFDTVDKQLTLDGIRMITERTKS